MTDAERDFDIAVVGVGGCGMMAALVAAQQGLRVALLEKTEKPGGGTALSSRELRAAGTRFQEALGIADSAERYARDIRERNGGRSDPALTERLARSSAEVTHWLADHLGMDFQAPEFRSDRSRPLPSIPQPRHRHVHPCSDGQSLPARRAQPRPRHTMRPHGKLKRHRILGGDGHHDARLGFAEEQRVHP